MAGFARWLSRTVWALSAFVWAWAMVAFGILAMTDWADRFATLFQIRYVVFAVGAVLAASGVFMFALAAAWVFPKANAWVTGMFMTAPWLALAVVLLGGLA